MTGPFFVPTTPNPFVRDGSGTAAPRPATVPDTGWQNGPTKALAAAQRAARDREPARAKAIADLSRRTGYTSAFVADHFDVLTEASRKPDFDPQTFARESPLVAAWLADDPNRVALLGPDLTRMSGVERQLRAMAQGFRQGREQVELSRIGSSVLQGTVTPAQRERQRRIETNQRLTTDFGLEGFVETALPTAAHQVPIYLQSLKAAGAGAAGGALVGGGVAGGVAAVGTKSPAATATAARAGAKFGAKVGAGGALLLANAEMEASLAVLDYERLLDARGVPLDAETARGAALVTGALAGALESVADIAGARLVPGARSLVTETLNNPTLRQVFGQYLRDVARSAVTEGATETVQSVITQLGGRVATAAQDGTLNAETVGGMLVDGDVWAQALAEGKAGVQASLVLGGASGGVSVAIDARRAVAAEKTATTLDRLAEAVADGKTVVEAPEEVAGVVRTLQQTGVEGGFFTAADWKELWQGVTAEDGTIADPREAVRQIAGDTKEYDHAVETDGAFSVPLDALLTRLMRTPELRAWAVEHVRVGPDGMNRKEATAFREAMQEQEAQASSGAAAATEGATAPVTVDTLSEGIEAEVREGLKAAGRSRTVAEAEAVIWSGMFRSLATRAGADPAQVADLFRRVTIRGLEALSDTTQPVGTVRQQAAPLTAVEADLLRATEAWEMRDDQPDAPVREIATALDLPVATVERYLAEPKPNLRPEQVRALGLRAGMVLEQAQEGGEALPSTIDIDGVQRPTTNANGAPIALTEEGVRNFWRWFGDSKVVAGDGRPLVVYHGTTEDFDTFAVSRTGQRMASKSKYGKGAIFFTSNQRVASDYATVGEDLGMPHPLDQPNVIPAYLSLENPLDIDAEGKSWALFVERVPEAQRAGHDGVIFRNIRDHALIATEQEVGGVDVFVAFKRGQVKSATGNSGAFGRGGNMLQQPGEAEPRGRIHLADNLSRIRIDLLKNANQSTFLHEAAHFYLAAARQLGAQPEAPPQFRDDLTAIYAWLGATPGEPLTVAQEEQFARGFEKYLRDHTAPSLEVRGAFQRFRAWLTRIYRRWRSLGVELTPEVVAIMDRMVATDAEIAAADAVLSPALIFADDPAIQRAHENAILAAREALDKDTLAVVFREEEAWYKAEVDAAAERIATELNDDPAYRARAILLSETLPDGSGIPGGNPLPQKLDKAGIVATVGEEAAKAFKPYYRVKGGATPDDAAGILGFPSGAALLTALAGTVPVKQRIQTLAEAAVREEHGDPLTDGTIDTKAAIAVHNTARAELLRLEMRKMEELHPAQVKAAFRKFGGRTPSTAALRETAATMLKGRTLRSLRNGIEFQRAEVKAAREAIAAATTGDWETAANAKLREALSAALYRETQDVLAAVEKQKRKFDKAFQSDAKLGKTRDLNYVNTARAVLARVGYGLTDKTPAEYLAATQSYTAPEEFARLRDVLDAMPIRRDDFRDLTVQEVETVAEVFGILWETSLDARTIEKDGVRVQRKDAIAQMDAATRDLTSPIAGAGLTRPWETVDTLKAGVLSARAWLGRVEHVVDYLDSLDPTKPWRKTLYERAREGTTAVTKAQRQFFEQVDTILSAMGPLPMHRIAAPELAAGWQWKSHAHLLGAMLHTGNASNKEKLLGGYGWSAVQWDAMVRRFERDGILTKAHYDALQALGDLFEQMKPEAQQAHKAIYGYFFTEIEPEPILTRYGQYRGWYAPAQRDPNVAIDAKQREAERQFEETHGFTFPQVAHGFTQERTASVAPLLLDLRLVKTHIAAVQRFVHLAPVVKDLSALLRDRDFLAVADRIDPRMVPDLLAPWLRRVSTMAVQTPIDGGPFGRAMQYLAAHTRSTASMAFMTLNVKNALENYLSLVGVTKLRIQQRHLNSALGEAVRHPRALATAIVEKSPFMAERMSAGVIEVSRRIDTMLVQPNALQEGTLWLREHSQFLQRWTQHHVETVAWWAAYEQALAEQAKPDTTEQAARNEREAIREADATVRMTLGGFDAVDVSRAETGTALWRVVVLFAGWFNMVLNLNQGEAMKAIRAAGLKQATPRLLYIYTFGIFVMAMGSAVLSRLFRGQTPTPDDDDEDGYLDDYVAWWADEHFRFGTATVPAIGQLVQLPVNKWDERFYNDRLTLSPAISFLESAIGAGPKGAYDVVSGDFTKADVKSLADFLALMTGTPSLSRPAGYLTDVQSGAATPSGPVDFGRGLVTGRP